jgi:RNA polymerase sigma-70 factor (ECF subfamily)
MTAFKLDPAAAERWLHWRREARAGNEAAKEQFLAEVRPFFGEILLSLARGRSSGAWDHSDVAQDCCLKLFRLPPEQEFRGATGPELIAWLTRIARRQALDAIRKERTKKRGGSQEVEHPDDAGDWDDVAAETSTPSQQAARNEEHADLNAALERLSDDHQRVIRLRIFENLSYAEIAQRLGRTEDAAKQLFHRALEKLSQEREKQP